MGEIMEGFSEFRELAVILHISVHEKLRGLFDSGMNPEI
jgi:hypothetical protein